MSLFKQEPTNTTEILDQSFWLNKNIKIKTSTFETLDNIGNLTS